MQTGDHKTINVENDFFDDFKIPEFAGQPIEFIWEELPDAFEEASVRLLGYSCFRESELLDH